MSSTRAAAGWYPDPNAPVDRYWDGSQWTTQTRPRGIAPAVAASVPARLKSERIVVAAPMSFAGSAGRLWNLADQANPLAKVLLIPVAIALIVVAWTVILIWYCCFGLLLVPYRLLRRGSRKRKRDAQQHREMLAAIDRRRL